MPIKVLVVDDEPGVRTSLVRALGLEGFDVSEAGDGEEALERVLERPRDVVVLDVAMPGHRRPRGLPAAAQERRARRRS